jgi:glutamine cyclotransferase
MQMTAQQGDVLLKRVTTLPKGTRVPIKKNSRGEMVLADGETTGHYHGILEEKSELFTLDGKVFMDLKEPATLTHQEHGHIKLEKGIWEVGRVNEYDYLSKMVRPVQD